MEQIYTVSQVNGYIKRLFVREQVLSGIVIRGEVSNCKYHSSGHIYFTLKDNVSRLACVMFAGNRSGLSFTLKDGMEVAAAGSIGVYERDGKYQLYVSRVYEDGTGILYERLEKLKQKLLEEGLFSDSHKKQIPYYAKKVGIVTADTGAVIRDIVNVAGRRNPYVQLVLYPVSVQGEGAAESIACGIKKMDSLGMDVIIVGRGGGSFEDLFAFNEEVTVRAIYECRTPVISAVGHETDTTLSDYAADLRAPTPSAAAELAVCELSQVYAKISDYKRALERYISVSIENRKNKLDIIKSRMEYLKPDEIIRQKRQYLADILDDLMRIIMLKEERSRQRLMLLSEKLNILSPLKRLSGGYSYVTLKDGQALESIKQVKKDDSLVINLADGKIYAVAEDMNKGESYGKIRG